MITVAGYAMATCLGDTAATFTAMCEGRHGAVRLPAWDAQHLNLTHGYPAAENVRTLLRTCLEQAMAGTPTGRTTVVLGTGLRLLRDLEEGTAATTADLAFADVIRPLLPDGTEVIELTNACAASGHALALAHDLLTANETDTAIAIGVDETTTSMRAMIGKIAPEPADLLRPFDTRRGGVLLGDGAAVAVLRRGGTGPVLRSVGLSCDAVHETAPSVEGIVRGIRDAHRRAGCAPEEVDFVIAHGTGTALNDPAEAAALNAVFDHRPPIGAVKGAVGHTSGAAALVNLIVAIESFRHRLLPPVIGLSDPIPELGRLNPVREPLPINGSGLAQVNAFGFGGVNAICLVEHR